MSKVCIKVDMGDELRQKLIEVNNQTTMLAIHNTLARMCDPYVPMNSGTLAQSGAAHVTSEGVTYSTPYARYQYYGMIYGPNIPIKENGQIVGWFSPPGQKKHPTGRYMSHSTEKHPLASSFWDKAMLRDHGDEFEREVKDILSWRLAKVGRYDG